MPSSIRKLLLGLGIASLIHCAFSADRAFAAAPDGQPSNVAATAPKSKAWSLLKLVEPSLPATRDADWTRNELDRFILAKLEAKGLRHSPQADRRTLIRRLSFDLTGLPPAEADVKAFIADPAKDAYEQLVDKLLASPRYGERWGRYWLDLARYSDTKGYVYAREERNFIHAWKYRDWVISALNEDLPYDQFLLKQIAADQLSFNDGVHLPDDLAAMGFLTVGRRFLGVVPDIVDDRIDITIRTTLGLTIGCARCHDHKFDPIPMADYYSLYGVFVGSTERLVCLDSKPKETTEYEKYAAGLRDRTAALNKYFDERKALITARLRDKTATYLAALPTLSKRPDDNFYTQLGVDDLNPVVLRQWQRYLTERARSFDPVFEPWHRLARLKAETFSSDAPVILRQLEHDKTHPLNPRVAAAFSDAKVDSLDDAANVYGIIFKQFFERHTAYKKNPSDARSSLADADDEQLRVVLFGDGSPARVPAGSIADIEWFFDEATRVQLNKLQVEIERWHLNAAGAPPYALILQDRPEQHSPHVFKRGNPNTQGDEVTRHFLTAVTGADSAPFSTGSGRLELARAIVRKDNPLTARVMVNRIWQHHFGVGLVATPSDFGNRGEMPSHPELLDWLASRFMNDGWSLKAIHRLIVTSATYRQESDSDSQGSTIDPDNRLLSHMNRTRLDYEAMRDELLAVSGELDDAMGGKPVDPSIRRRTIYTKIDRQFVPGLARAFDFACPDLHISQRAATTSPQQALFFMNDPFVLARAKALASRAEIKSLTQDADKIRQAYQIIFQRDPTADQLKLGQSFMEKLVGEQRGQRATTSSDALIAYFQSLLMSNEFMFID